MLHFYALLKEDPKHERGLAMQAHLKSLVAPVEKPAEKPVEKPAEKPAEKPVP